LRQNPDYAAEITFNHWHAMLGRRNSISDILIVPHAVRLALDSRAAKGCIVFTKGGGLHLEGILRRNNVSPRASMIQTNTKTNLTDLSTAR
jgi:hypothetical protein